MHTLWKLVKIGVALAIALPLGLLVLAVTLGVAGAMVRLAFVALRLASVGLVGYGLYRLVRHFFGPAHASTTPEVRDLPRTDPYYEAAMRDLDAEFRGSSRG